MSFQDRTRPFIRTSAILMIKWENSLPFFTQSVLPCSPLSPFSKLFSIAGEQVINQACLTYLHILISSG